MAIYKNYLDDFLELMRDDTAEVVFNENTIKDIQKSILQWISIKQRLDRKLLIQYNTLKKEDNLGLGRISSHGKNIDISASGLRQILVRYTEQKRRIRNLREIEDITNHFKKGYELIHRIRELLTGQDITYTILYTGGKETNGENLLEAHLTIDQLLSGVSLALSDINDIKTNQELSNVASLNISNSAIKRTVDGILGKKQNTLQTVINAIDNPELWDSLVDYRNRKIAGGMSKYTANMGRIYEVYSILRRVDKYKSISYIGHKDGEPNTENLANALLQDAIENSDPGWQIGDVGLEQLKSVFNAEASLISVSTIEKVLNDIYNALSISHKDEMSQALKNIFTTQREKFNNKLDAKVEQEAIITIDKTVQDGVIA